ncbi:peptidoglycan DD-metalloendopeptidase family protein [Sulfitobacter sp. HNIBRBA2951]|uniref:peptidoglycan DD-metalloendopeptidase family protein n=1 Tax=Sulfitobacter aquimarinus TaxID=3158557 RepID=UPI0032DF4C5A
MTVFNKRIPMRISLLAGVACVGLAGCSDPLDFDLRGLGGGFSTANAAQAPLAERPKPDDRGVISYPNYQVAVARRGDTLVSVANRVGLPVAALAKFNGIDPKVTLRKDEVIALPSRVAEPSPATGATTTGPIKPVDVTAVAGGAIERAPATPGVQTTALKPAAQTGREPTRHKVERGETAFTVARLYSVPVKDLAEWNGLAADFAIREGQFLLIPVASQNPPKTAPAKTATATLKPPLPGQGSATPTPPSATKPLPDEKIAPAAAPAKPAATPTAPTQTAAAPKPAPAPAPKPVADVGKTTKPAAKGRLVRPVAGTIIRDYAKGRNEGINIKAAPGSAVKAAEAGTVIALTKSPEGVPIIIVRHPDQLITVYANVDDVSVKTGQKVQRGESIAKLRSGDDSFVHFQVRKGTDSVDPNPFLN